MFYSGDGNSTQWRHALKLSEHPNTVWPASGPLLRLQCALLEPLAEALPDPMQIASPSPSGFLEP